jgi:general secretion pathway protein K
METRKKFPVAAVYDRRRSSSVKTGRTEFGSAVIDRRSKSERERGAAIMLSLWALFVLSAMIIAWALNIDARLGLSGSANRTLEAVAMACSGAEVAMHPATLPGSPLLRRGFGGNRSYETRITGEGGRLNLRWLIAGEDPAKLEVLRKYLEVKGVDLNERDRMIDCLLDWVDPDNLVRINGAEDEGDYKAPNRLLTSLEEVKRIAGWAEFTSNDDWDKDFTLNSTGPIDFAWASRDVLLALPGMTEGLADQYLAMRPGPDGIDGTEDDPFKSREEVRFALGFSKEQFKQLEALTNPASDPVLRVVSVGKSGDATRTVRMVIRKAGASIQLIPGTWKEL